MQLSDKIKKFSVEQAIDYLNKNPVKNLPKLLDWAGTFCAGKFEGQRRAIRKACLDPTDVHYPMVQHILNDIDPAVLKTTLVNFFIYGNIIGCERQDQLRAQYVGRCRGDRPRVGISVYITHGRVRHILSVEQRRYSSICFEKLYLSTDAIRLCQRKTRAIRQKSHCSCIPDMVKYPRKTGETSDLAES